MTAYFDVGDDRGGTSPSVLNLIQISVDPVQTETVTISNLAGGDTLSYFSNTTSIAAGTIAASASQAFTTPVWIRSAGRSSVTITGGKY